MATTKVRVLRAVVKGKREGEVLVLHEKTAEMLIRNGYVELVEEPKKKEDPKKDEEKE